MSGAQPAQGGFNLVLDRAWRWLGDELHDPDEAEQLVGAKTRPLADDEKDAARLASAVEQIL